MNRFKNFGIGLGIGLVIGIISFGISSSRFIYLSSIDPSMVMWIGTIIAAIPAVYFLFKKKIALATGIIVGFVLPIVLVGLLLLLGCASSHVCP